MPAEERLARLEEHMLVHAELVTRFERRVDAFIERTDRQLESHAGEMLEFRATVSRALDLLERFVSGQGGGNGHA